MSELEIPIVSVRQVPTPVENDEDLEVEEQEAEDEEAVAGPGDKVIKRGPGRSKMVRTGQRGRPQKVYHEIQEEASVAEFGLTCEIPIKEAMAGPEVSEWDQAIAAEMKSII